MSYSLKRGVCFCVSAGRAVFLDIAGDRYFCLPPALDADFQRLVAGEGFAQERSVVRLIELGIIVDADDEPIAARRPHLPLPTSDLSDETSANFGWIFWATVEQVIARARLKWSAFPSVIQSLETTPQGPGRPDANANLCSKVAGAFAGSRLLIHSWDQCLSQSLAFHRTCRRLQIDAKFVIGIRLDPFAAHCWVQREDVVLNDSLERVRHYTPILAA